MNAVDTNVLLYVRDERNPAKRNAAASLIASMEDACLLWQVACEYLAASRKLAARGFTPAMAGQDLEDYLQDWPLIQPTQASLKLATLLCSKFSLSVWDGLLVAACNEAGVKRLYSEDLGGMSYKRIAGVELINPFA